MKDKEPNNLSGSEDAYDVYFAKKALRRGEFIDWEEAKKELGNRTYRRGDRLGQERKRAKADI